MSTPDQPLLRKGASVRVIAPSRWIERSVAEDVIKLPEASEFNIQFSDQCFRQLHQLAGADLDRAAAFEAALSDPDVDAIWFARGGYGAGRVMENVDWAKLTANAGAQSDKCVIGYSDATPLLETVSRLGLATAIHGSMPVDVTSDMHREAPPRLLRDLVATPRGMLNRRAILQCSVLRPGAAKGALRGGNLTLLTKMLCGVHRIRSSGSILVIEDVEEYDYAIDRDLLCLRQAGVLAELAGIVVGQFTKTIASSVPFDQTVAEMVLHHARDYTYPILHGLSSGHGTPNEPLVIDETVAFVATADSIEWDDGD